MLVDIKEPALGIKGIVTISEFWAEDIEPVIQRFIARGCTLHQALKKALAYGVRPFAVDEVHNLVTTVGKNTFIRDFLRGTPVTGLEYFAVGTGATAPALGDTALGTEVYRDIITGFTTGTSLLQVDHYIGSAQANGHDLYEAGVFGNGAAGSSGSGTMFCRTVHTAKTKNSTKALTYAWEHTFTSVTS